MLLTRLKARGFRSLCDVEISFGRLTLLIGGNDAGKSSILDLLEIVLQDGEPDEDDYLRLRGEKPFETIEVILEFQVDPRNAKEARRYVHDEILRIRKVYTLDGAETFYWDRFPEDKRLRHDDFEKSLTAAQQEDLVKAFDPSAVDELSNKQERADWLRQCAKNAPQTAGWKKAPRGWGTFLPRFYRYSTMDYDDPSAYVFNTLQQVFRGVLYEDDESQRLVADLREVKSRAEGAINEKVAELLSYIRRYSREVQDISYEPIVDFSRGLRQGQFQINDGRGFHYLAKTGDGTKRRMFLATLDWDRDVTLKQATERGPVPPSIRGYDEPDTNLDYRAQRTMCRAISKIVDDERTRTQVILCTHSPPVINRMPAQDIRLLRLCNGCTEVEELQTSGDDEVEAFLRESARELGITNTLIFYERCFILIEGETEDNALPILYRKLYRHSLLEDGIRPVNLKGNGAAKEFLRLLSHNRQELTIVFLDGDTRDSNEARLTEETLEDAGFEASFIRERVRYVGDREFEDAFADEVIARCLQNKWPKAEGEWTPEEVSTVRQLDKKFSDALWDDLVCQSTAETLRSSWSKPVFGKELARCCRADEIPEAINDLFETARQIAQCD